MKYKLICVKDYETVIPADRIIFKSLVTGELMGKGIEAPEERFMTNCGQAYTARIEPYMLTGKNALNAKQSLRQSMVIGETEINN